MTDASAFSADEWTLLRTTPLVAGLAVAKAAPSGFRGSLRELRTLLTDIGHDEPDHTDTPLLHAISEAHPRWHLERLTGSDTAQPEVLADTAIDDVRRAMALLRDRATDAEVDAYRRWVLSIAHHVAQAATEDDDLESAPERAVIARIDAALAD